ncbi:tetratricopeptide repeat protein [Jannaschia sp. W003]|uniref:tetratricopeptide repeat protein n=1 Tax=Jannaschia sp. W003 TaxID=2867012 RepID=UPI0021A689F6|nr:tetratricopeptide repeat protein [Jannaschia sp. W003]UWQ23204.1 tetratricopeptide repeat protein [Jannaschia sp. W003]
MTRFAIALSGSLLLSTALPLSAATFDGDTARSYTGDVTGWLLRDDMLERSTRASDPEALAAVARLFREGHPRASVALQNYFERHPTDPAAFDLSGLILLGEQKYDTALISFDRAAALGADGPWFDVKHGLAQLLSGHRDEGVSLLEDAIAAEPANPLARRYLAWAAMQEGNLPRAIEHSQVALSSFGVPRGTVNRAHLDLANLYRQAQRHEDVHTLLRPTIESPDPAMPPELLLEAAGLFFEAAFELRDEAGMDAAMARFSALGLEGTPQFRLGQARTALVADRPEEAIEIIETLRAQEPDLAASLVPDLARAEARAGRVDAAVSRLVQHATAEDGPGNVAVLREAAALVLSEGTPEAAETFASTLLAPENGIELRYLGAEVLARAGFTDRALGAAQALRSAAPDEGSVHRLLGLVLSELGRGEEAAAALRDAVAASPDDEEAWLMLVGAVHGHDGYTHAAAGDSHGEVIELLTRAVEANPDSARLRTELGLVHLSDGDLDAAASAIGAALVRSPGYLPALSLGALVEADRGAALDRAAELADLAALLAPESAIVTDIQGWIAYRRGDEEEAVRLVEAALARDPEDTTTLYHRGVLAEAQGDADAARDLYLRSLRLGDMYRHYSDAARAGLARLGSADAVTGSVIRLGAADAGVEEVLGTVTVTPSEEGVLFAARIAGLPEGPNAVHVHENPSCRPSAEGVVGGEAGPHYGHAHRHMAMADGSAETEGKGMAMAAVSGEAMTGMDATAKPRGDLDPFVFDAGGETDATVAAPQLTLDELRGRSLMIHQGPDEDGRSGPKIACAILR